LWGNIEKRLSAFCNEEYGSRKGLISVRDVLRNFCIDFSLFDQKWSCIDVEFVLFSSDFFRFDMDNATSFFVYF
jgi:hypothetical protein